MTKKTDRSKKLNRHHSLFDGSRLYKQAEEGSGYLLDKFLVEPAPFHKVIENISKTLNWFIESSFMRYPGEGVTLSESVFKECISESFEKDVCALLQGSSFAAGTVSDKGTWDVKDITGQKVHFSHKLNRPIRGEVDVLAFHSQKQEVLVIECKVLGSPVKINKLKYIFAKISEQDIDSFHSKLQNKIEWFKETDFFSNLTISEFIGVILLDRPVPGMGKFDSRDFYVIDFITFKNFVRNRYNRFAI